MAKITLEKNEISTLGQLPEVGTKAPDFKLVSADLSEISLADFKGSRVVLNIFPSVDTPVCATSVKKFNEKVTSLENTKVVCVSKDLPFAFGRFCGAEKIEHVTVASDFRTGNFGKDYQLEINSGVLSGLLSRCIVVIDENQKVLHAQQVSEIVDEPDYEAALAVL